MWWVTKKEAREIARQEADRLLNQYVRGLRYRECMDDIAARGWTWVETAEQDEHWYRGEVRDGDKVLAVAGGFPREGNEIFLRAYDDAIRKMKDRERLLAELRREGVCP